MALSLFDEALWAARRPWKLAPLPPVAISLLPVMGIKAWVEPAAVLWRIMTPPLTRLLVPAPMLTTRAIMVASPLRVLYA